MKKVINWLVNFSRLSWYDRLNRLDARLAALKTDLFYRHVFGSLGRGCKIFKPLLLTNPRFVFIGDGLLMRPGCRLQAVVADPGAPPRLIIGNNVNIEQHVHIVCSHRIVIGDNVTITGNCGIVDTVHPYRDVHLENKVGERLDKTPTPVEIGDHTFVGFGSVILPNVRIGRNCVIGANSTVTRDIPDYCVAAGTPAKILDRYDLKEQVWTRVNRAGAMDL